MVLAYACLWELLRNELIATYAFTSARFPIASRYRDKSEKIQDTALFKFDIGRKCNDDSVSYWALNVSLALFPVFFRVGIKLIVLTQFVAFGTKK